MFQPSKDLLRLASPHYHGDIRRYLNGEKVGDSFLKMLSRNARLMKALERVKKVSTE